MDTKEQIKDYLKQSHTGKERAISSLTLEMAFGLSNREVRRCVNALRRAGTPVCSDEAGYYYAATVDEVMSTVSQLQAHIDGTKAAIDGMTAAKKRLTQPSITINYYFNN